MGCENSGMRKPGESGRQTVKAVPPPTPSRQFETGMDLKGESLPQLIPRARKGKSTPVDSAGTGAGERTREIMLALPVGTFRSALHDATIHKVQVAAAWDMSHYKTENRKEAMPVHAILRVGNRIFHHRDALRPKVDQSEGVPPNVA